MSEIIEYIAVGLLVLGVALALVITTIHPPMPIDPRQCRTSRRTRLSEHRRHPDIRPFTATDCGQRPDHGCRCCIGDGGAGGGGGFVAVSMERFCLALGCSVHLSPAPGAGHAAYKGPPMVFVFEGIWLTRCTKVTVRHRTHC